MAVQRPDTLAPLARIEYQTSREIQAVDWTDLFAAANFRYRMDGGRAFGFSFDPAFTRPDSTADGTYSQVDNAGNYDLTDTQPLQIARRPLEDAGTTLYEWELEVYGQYYDVRANLYREETGSRVNILTLTASDSSGSWVWTTTDGTTSDDDVFEGGSATGSDPQVLTWDVEARSSDASNGASILQVRCSASRISTSTLYPADFNA